MHFKNENLNQSESKVESPASTTTSLISYQGKLQSQVVLGTAVVDILDSIGKYYPCRALLDSCSQCNSITQRLANSLGLSKKKTDIKLKGVENLNSGIKFMTSYKNKIKT